MNNAYSTVIESDENSNKQKHSKSGSFNKQKKTKVVTVWKIVNGLFDGIHQRKEKRYLYFPEVR